MEEDATIHDLLAILKRRKWSLIVPAVAVFLIALVTAVIIPPTYRSSSTILIEDQELSREYVASFVSGFAEQRLQMINQRIMSTARLMEIINRFNLYAGYRKYLSTEEIIDLMRKDTKLETISANVIDSRSGAAKTATIAFSLSYEGKNPEVVQQVASALASVYLEENLKVREQQTTGAYKFLEDEANDLKGQLAAIDAKISVFKSQNVTALPELFPTNLQVLDRIDRDIDMTKAQLGSLKERQSFLQSQLATLPKEGTDKAFLKQLKADLVQLESRFSDHHPDVIKTKTEIAKLEARIKSESAGQAGSSAEDTPDNDAYIALAAQLAGIETEINSANHQLWDLNRKRDLYRRRIDSSPKVDEVYKTLMAERNNTQSKYDDLMKKTLEAKVAQGLEKGQMGERFTLIDPARLPEKPVKPNVPAILLVGLFLGIGSGVGMAALREHLDRSVRSVNELAKATGKPVLAGLPEIVTWEDRQQEKQILKKIFIVLIGLAVIAIVLVHFLVMDLDILWNQFIRRIFA